MKPVKVYVSDRFLQEWDAAADDLDADLANGALPADRAAAYTELRDALSEGETRYRSGVPIGVTIVLHTLGALTFLRGEAEYRWHYCGGGGNPYGVDPEYLSDYRAGREASARLIKACDKAITTTTKEN